MHAPIRYWIVPHILDLLNDVAVLARLIQLALSRVDVDAPLLQVACRSVAVRVPDETGVTSLQTTDVRGCRVWLAFRCLIRRAGIPAATGMRRQKRNRNQV